MVRCLFLIMVVTVLGLVCTVPSDLYAQSNSDRFVHQISSELKVAPAYGRDLWFCIPQNYRRSDPGATFFFAIYISSPRKTTAWVQFGTRPKVAYAITANQSRALFSPSDIPLSFQLESSDVTEDKTIHIWSDDAVLSVYLLSRAPYTSDGMYVIPTIGWGQEYVVASYNAIVDPSGQADWPSEFCIVASQDNTQVFVTPTNDIRQDGFPNIVAHPAGQTFSVILNKGQCVEYQTTEPAADGTDLTGSHITSTKPIGVIGASVCPYIPIFDGYCDHIVDMLPPVRSWGSNYCTISPFPSPRPAVGNYPADLFLVVGTKQGQVVNRNGNQAAVLGAPFTYQFIYDIITPSLWTSTDPFMLVQYHQGSTHNEGNNPSQLGDPDMVVVNPAEQYGKKVIFQVPSKLAAASQANFRNSVWIIVPKSHENQTTFDGHRLNAVPSAGYKAMPGSGSIGGSGWKGIELDFAQNTNETSHTIASDTGVGVYQYGYSNDDNYSWAGALGVSDPTSKDTLPPIADTTGLCFCAHIKVRDNRPGDSKINSMTIDTIYNVTFTQDPNFIDAVGTDSSFYDICVIDSSQEAYISVTVFDRAGNATTIVSQYTPNSLTFQPCPLTFSGGAVGSKITLYDTIYNSGKFPYGFSTSSVKLELGNKGFTIDSMGADGVLQPGAFRVIKVTFIAAVKQNVSDTITVFDGCRPFSCVYTGNGGAIDFIVEGYDFGCVLPDSTKSSVGMIVSNPGKLPAQIDTIYVEDPVHFGYNQNNPASNKLPFIVPGGNVQTAGTYPVTFTCTPTKLGALKTAVHYVHKAVNVTDSTIDHIDTLRATGCGPDISVPIINDTSVCGAPLVERLKFTNSSNALSLDVLIDTVIQSVGKDTSVFKALTFEDNLGNPITLPHTFKKGDVFIVDVTFAPKGTKHLDQLDTIYLIGAKGDTIPNAIGYVHCVAVWRDMNVIKGTVNFNSLAFGSPKQTLNFQVTNPYDDPLTIFKFDIFNQPPAHDPGAFRLTGNYVNDGVAGNTMPIILNGHKVVNVEVEFDPSFILDVGQEGFFGIESDGCFKRIDSLFAKGATTSGPPNIQGFDHPPILSCANAVDSIRIKNSSGNTKQFVGYTMTGANPGSFIVTAALPVTLPPGSITAVPVAFTPTPSVGATTYSAQVIAAIIDQGQTDTSYQTSDSIIAHSNNMVLTVNSSFTKNFLSPSDVTTMNIDLGLNKNALTDPLSDAGITKVVLKYTYNTDMLDFGGVIKNAFTSSIPGWTLDAANSGLDVPTQTLTLTLSGTQPLTDANTQLGQIAFKAMLPQSGTSSSVTLTSAQLLNGTTGNPVPKCILQNKQDTGITLVFQCGDSTIRNFMNGQPFSRIVPVSPNPVTERGASATFRYAQKAEGKITLSLYDALGNEVARILDGVHHPAGSFEVFFDTGRLPSGSYVYRFTFDHHSVQSGTLVIDR